METKSSVLRLFSLSWGGMLFFAAYLIVHFGFGWIPSLPLLLGGAYCVAGLVCPALMRSPFRFVEWLLRPLGECISVVMLAVVFFAIVTPYAAVLRLLRWDPLWIRRRNSGGSAWRRHRVQSKNNEYHWQY